MSTFTLIVITVVSTVLILSIIGHFVQDNPSEEEVPQPLNENDLNRFKREQATAFETLTHYAPSIIRSSIVMAIIQIIAISGFFIGICILVYVGFTGVSFEEEGLDHQSFMISLLIETSIMLMIFILARMVRRRNKYIIALENLLRND